MCYPMGNNISNLTANCTKTKAEVRILFDLKSSVSLIIYVHTEHLFSKASTTTVNKLYYII